MRYTITVDTDTVVDDIPLKDWNLWHLVSMFYPGYSHSQDIADSDTLQRIVDGEWRESSEDGQDRGCSAWQMIQDDWDGDVDRAQLEAGEQLIILNSEIYERTMEAFLSSIVSVERVKE